MKDYYSILGIPRYSSEQTIKEAYRRMAKRWHPDANNGDENAQRMMQDLNRAKEILFDADTREDYRKVLEMQDVLTAENIQKIRKRWSDKRFQQIPKMPEPKPFAKARFIILLSLISIAIGVAIFKLSEISSSKQRAGDPIDNIIARNSPQQLFPSLENDTTKIPDASPDRLEQIASALAMMDEYKSAAKYWEKYLETDPHNLEVTTSLMLAYLKRDEYAKAVQTIRDHVVGDSNLIIIYSTLGDYFRQQHKTFDSENTDEKIIELGSKMVDPSDRIKYLIQLSKKRIANR